ncbi:hypothetical protein LI951_14045 [Enterococcus sp. BWT-B8]|uniref:hypothetical protein n=1 Tax=Enterococcus sp. BWT-B8 TaxID=2885157 RepID=UPI001E62A711|nr:hypothetical protein [Enterococcus sp. BWT-B8]MCB5953194.1 hypothetical protein [Enterococcus sp. BWT-B8]
MKKASLNTKLKIILFTVIALFCFTHLTPEIALRSNIFFSGHFKEAFSSKVEKSESTEKEKFRYSIFFKVSPPPLDDNTHSYLETYEVKSVFGVFYWAKYFGEA